MRIFYYSIEIWSKISRRYTRVWSGTDIEIAERMMNKPYISKHTRRLITIEVRSLMSAKANKRAEF